MLINPGKEFFKLYIRYFQATILNPDDCLRINYPNIKLSDSFGHAVHPKVFTHNSVPAYRLA